MFSLTALVPRLQPTVTHLSASQVMVWQLVRGGVSMEKGRGERGNHLLVSLPLLLCPFQVPLLSWAHRCCVCGLWVVVDHVRGRTGAGRGGVWWDAVQRDGMVGPRVTAVDPPSLTVRTPLPHPRHLRNNSRMPEFYNLQFHTTGFKYNSL